MEQKLQTTDHEAVAQRLYTGLLGAAMEFDALQSVLTADLASEDEDNRTAWLNMIERHVITARASATQVLEAHAGVVGRVADFPWAQRGDNEDFNSRSPHKRDLIQRTERTMEKVTADLVAYIDRGDYSDEPADG